LLGLLLLLGAGFAVLILVHVLTERLGGHSWSDAGAGHVPHDIAHTTSTANPTGFGLLGPHGQAGGSVDYGEFGGDGGCSGDGGGGGGGE
jgi:hypothetical protein